MRLTMAGVKEKKDNGVRQQEKTYIYLLIQFNKRGPKTGKQDYDFVPASWVYVSKKTGKLVVKFMPPPYLEETSHLLHHLIKSLSDPIADWPEYNVQIKGGAASYKDAETRIAELDANTKEYAFTTDADEMPQDKASRIVCQVKQTKLKISAETEAALEVPGLNSDPEDDSPANEPLNTAPRQLSKPRGSRSTFIGTEDTSTDSSYHNQRGNRKGRDFEKMETNGTSGLKVFDHNENLEMIDLNNRKTIGKAANHKGHPKIQNISKGSTLNINTQPSTSKNSTIHFVDENLNMSDGSLPESIYQSHRSRYRLTVNNVYTDSDDEGHIDQNRNVESARDRHLQSSTKNDFYETPHGDESVSSYKKPSKPKSEKSSHRHSNSSSDKRSKSSRLNDQPHFRHGDPKSNPTKTTGKSNSRSGKKKLTKSRELKSRDDFTSDSELLWQIYEDLQSVKLNVEEIRANQRTEEEIRQKHKIQDGIQEDFISKHNLDLPFANKENFDEFNEDLLSNEDFRKEFMKSLVKFFDKDMIASKTVCNILKKYLTRKLALKYTTIKKMPRKFLMKETAFFDCLLGVLADTHRDKSGKFLSESTFSSVLGTVLGNAKDWDGKQNRKNLESDSDEASCTQANAENE